MSQISYRANLSAAIFPLSLAAAGRSVIVPGPDNVYDRRVDPTGEQKNAGIPQAIYLENVIPTANGYQSVGYSSRDSLPFTSGTSIQQIPVLGSQIYPVTLAFKAPNSLYSSSTTGLDTWTAVTFTTGIAYPLSGRITSAVVRGVCYVFIKGATNKIFTATYVGPNIELAEVAFIGVAAADVQEICAAFNYLVIITTTGFVQWSSTTTPLDFTISLVTGAGSASPNNAYNKLTYIEACPTGFYLFTPTGIIHGQYTGNSRYPWKFVPVVNTTQILSFSHHDVNASSVVVLDGTGSIRNVEGPRADLIAPELSSFLRQVSKTDVYNYATNTLSTQAAIAAYYPKIYLLFDRYVLMSGDATADSAYTSIYLYDLQLQRYGKLKINHSDIVLYDTNALELNRNTFGVVDRATGTCKSVSFSLAVGSDPHQAVLILGKFQYVRSRFLQMHSAEIEGTLTNASQVLLPSLDGKNFDTAVSPYIDHSDSTLLSCSYRADAKNHSLVIKGQFAVESVELLFTPTSDR